MSARPSDPNELATCRTDLGPLTRKLLEQQQEIERLRVIVQGWEHSARNAERDMATLRAERDEARRSVCEMSIQLGGVYRRIGGKVVEVTTPEGCAEIMRWDCFKERT